MRLATILSGAALLITRAAAAQSDPTTPQGSQAVPYQVDFQVPASPLMEQIYNFNILLVVIIVSICVFVLALLLWVMLRYNSRANPEARKFSHNTTVEVVWTVVPIIILIVIAIPSFKLLRSSDTIPDGQVVTFAANGATAAFALPEALDAGAQMDVQLVGADGSATAINDYRIERAGDGPAKLVLASAPPLGNEVRVLVGSRRIAGHIVSAPEFTIKATGYQWYWGYHYPDHGDFEFFANMLEDDQLGTDMFGNPQPRLLAADQTVVVPVDTTVRVIVTGADVIHDWAMPAFGVKMDAVPGRLNETWFHATREGMFYGQCSELCGARHAFMPIALAVVSRARFEEWIRAKQEELGVEPGTGLETPSAAIDKTETDDPEAAALKPENGLVAG